MINHLSFGVTDGISFHPRSGQDVNLLACQRSI